MKILDYNVIKALPMSVAMEGCFVINMPNDVYHKFGGVSKSGLDKIAESPAAYKSQGEYTTSRAIVVGSALHAAILEPDLFASEYHLLLEVKDRRAAEYKTVSKLYGADYTLVQSECENLNSMLLEAKKDAEISGYFLKLGFSEISAFIRCPDTGVLLRCRYDYLVIDENLCVDLKKTRDASYDGFSKSIDSYRYHVQDAMYSHVYKLLTNCDLTFKFVAIQETAPHTARVYTLDEHAKMIGDYYFKRDLAVFADCYKRNFWPHSGCNGEIGLQSWAIAKYEQEIDAKLMNEFEGE